MYQKQAADKAAYAGSKIQTNGGTCMQRPQWKGCPRTMRGIVMGAAHMLTQGFDNCTNLQDRDSTPAKRHGLAKGFQTSSYGARKVLGTIPYRKSNVMVVKQDCVEK